FMRLLTFVYYSDPHPRDLHSFPTRRSSDLTALCFRHELDPQAQFVMGRWSSVDHHESALNAAGLIFISSNQETVREGFRLSYHRSEEHTSELQSRFDLVCRLLLEKKNLSLH